MVLKKRLKPKRKWVVVFTILITITSLNVFNYTIEIINNRNDFINKKATECDQSHGYTCSYYEIRQYLLNK